MFLALAPDLNGDHSSSPHLVELAFNWPNQAMSSPLSEMKVHPCGQMKACTRPFAILLDSRDPSDAVAVS
jgi:hypothetical protein